MADAATIATLAGLAISAAGAGYGVESSQAAASKMNSDTANTVAQLDKLQKQATPIYQQNLQKATNVQGSQQQGVGGALGQYQALAGNPVTSAPLSLAPPSQGQDARTAANIARTQQANAAVAQYPALESGWNVGNALTNARLGNLGAIGSGVVSTLPSQLSQAQAQGQVGQSIGAGIGSLGGALGAYGAANNPQSAANTFNNNLVLAQLQAMLRGQTGGGFNSTNIDTTTPITTGNLG